MRTRELFASLTLKPQKLAIYTIYRREVITPTNCKHVNVLRMKYILHSINIYKAVFIVWYCTLNSSNITNDLFGIFII